MYTLQSHRSTQHLELVGKGAATPAREWHRTNHRHALALRCDEAGTPIAVTIFDFDAIRLGIPHAGGEHQILNLGDFALESGITLPNAKLSYVTHGALNASKSNAILVPSCYAGDHHDYDFLIGPGKALDPNRYFIIATDMLGNGLSSSPSNTPSPFDGPTFPEISTRDNVKAGYRLATGSST